MSMTGEVFAKGSMWWPIINSQNGTELIQPWMYKADIGSMRPVIMIKFGEIFETVISYENIVSFTYELPTGESTLSFVDSTPLMVIEMVRSIMNKKDAPMECRFGWAIQNMPEGIDISKEASRGNDTDGYTKDYVLSRPLDMYPIGLSYKYTNFGILVDMKLVGFSKNILNSVKIKKGTNGYKSAKDTSSLARILTNIINNHKDARVDGNEYQVLIQSKEIKIDKVKDIEIKEDLSISEFLSSIHSALYVPTKDKENPKSTVEMHIPSHKTVVDDGKTKKEVQNIIFYVQEKEAKTVYTPFIEYPSQESPIKSFQPNIDDSQGMVFLSQQNYITIDKNGNRVVSTKKTTSIAGIDPPPASQGQTEKIDGADATTQNTVLQNRILATIDITALGDPLFSSTECLFQSVYVRNAIIVVDGNLRFKEKDEGPTDKRKGVFSSYPGFSLGDKGKDTSFAVYNNMSAEDAQMDSPLNGKYLIQKITHEISAANGYQTSLSLMYWPVESTE